MDDTEECVEFSPQVLDRVWVQWLNENVGQSLFFRHASSYKHVDRNRNQWARIFEIWLFKEGGTVIQRDGKRYIKFNDAAQASFFMLKYA